MLLLLHQMALLIAVGYKSLDLGLEVLGVDVLQAVHDRLVLLLQR